MKNARNAIRTVLFVWALCGGYAAAVEGRRAAAADWGIVLALIVGSFMDEKESK